MFGAAELPQADIDGPALKDGTGSWRVRMFFTWSHETFMAQSSASVKEGPTRVERMNCRQRDQREEKTRAGLGGERRSEDQRRTMSFCVVRPED